MLEEFEAVKSAIDELNSDIDSVKKNMERLSGQEDTLHLKESIESLKKKCDDLNNKANSMKKYLDYFLDMELGWHSDPRE